MTFSIPVTDPDEWGDAATIERRIKQGYEIVERFARADSHLPRPGSDLDGDDAVTAWMNSSHVVTTTLTMATENIRAVGAMLRPVDRLVFPMYAHYPVIRSVLEAAAEVKWILISDDRKTRVGRVLRARWNDVKEDSALAKVEREMIAAMGETIPTEAVSRMEQAATKRHARDIAKIRAIAAEQGIPWSEVTKGLPWIHIIKSVCRIEASSGITRVPGEYAAGMWKIMSGLSHPSTTRTVRHSAMDENSKSEDGIIEAKLSASLRWTVESITVAWNTTLEAVELLEGRKGDK